MDLIIRQGVFETNSSSTHTITIAPNNDVNLIENDIMYLSKLKINLDDKLVLAVTPIEKTALIACWFCSYFEEEYDHKGEFLESIINKLSNNLGISKIDTKDYPDFHPYVDEYYTFESVDYYINEVINKDVKIQISREEW